MSEHGPLNPPQRPFEGGAPGQPGKTPQPGQPPRSRRARRGVSGDIDDITWETGQFSATEVAKMLEQTENQPAGPERAAPEPERSPDPQLFVSRRGSRRPAADGQVFEQQVAESSDSADETTGSTSRRLLLAQLQNHEQPVKPTGKASFVERVHQVARHRGFPVVVAAVLLVALSFFVGWFITEPAPAPAAVHTNAGVSLICPGFNDGAEQIVGSLNGTATIRQIGNPNSAQVQSGSGDFTVSGLSGAYIVKPISANVPVTAAMQFTEPGHFAQAMCGQALASQYLQLASSDGAVVRLINPDQTDAVLNVTIFGPSTLQGGGMMNIPALLDVRVAADSVKDINLADFAPGLTPVAVRVQTTLGRVFAIGRVTQGDTPEISVPTRSSQQVIIPGVPNGATSTTLWLANPGTTRTKVRVDSLGDSGRVTVAGAESVTVEAGSVASVDLTSSLQGDMVSLALTADQPIIGSTVSAVGDDQVVVSGALTTEGATHEMSSPLSGAATLMLSNFSTQDVHFKLNFFAGADSPATPIDISLDAGSSRVFVPPDTYRAVRVSAPSQVVVSVITRPNPDSSTEVAVTPLFLGLADMGETPIRESGQVLYQPK